MKTKKQLESEITALKRKLKQYEQHEYTIKQLAQESGYSIQKVQRLIADSVILARKEKSNGRIFVSYKEAQRVIESAK